MWLIVATFLCWVPTNYSLILPLPFSHQAIIKYATRHLHRQLKATREPCWDYWRGKLRTHKSVNYIHCHFSQIAEEWDLMSAIFSKSRLYNACTNTCKNTVCNAQTNDTNGRVKKKLQMDLRKIKKSPSTQSLWVQWHLPTKPCLQKSNWISFNPIFKLVFGGN